MTIKDNIEQILFDYVADPNMSREILKQLDSQPVPVLTKKLLKKFKEYKLLTDSIFKAYGLNDGALNELHQAQQAFEAGIKNIEILQTELF